MIKKVLALVLAISMIGIPVLSASMFADLPESHWGYSSVNKLVTDGTVKGYEDGTFRPDNTVTRAEFVKMMGVGPERRDKDFSDVPSTHWGYEYIMTSGFNIKGNDFLPDKPITRGETIELLWKRQGSAKGIIAPSVITNQYAENKDAVAWAYNHKIMMGDDGVQLRLSDSLSRVEAAALIIRTRETDYSLKQTNFKDNVSSDVLKAVFESYSIFDEGTAYSPDKTITNGEMARATLRLLSDEYNLSYLKYNYVPKFEHEYGKDITVVATDILNIPPTKEYADKKANVEDTLAAFTYAVTRKSDNNISGADNYYKDVSSEINYYKNNLLTVAYEKGVQLNGDGTIGAQNNVTHKDIAAILLQLDSIFGSQTVVSSKKNAKAFVKYPVKLNIVPGTYPKNKDDFACIVAGVDNIVYEKAVKSKTPAKASYNFAREYAELFMSTLSKLSDHVNATYGVDAEFILYPNLVWDNGSGFTLRLKCKVLSVKDPSVTVNSIFEGTLVTPVEGNLSAGMEFFVEIQIGYAALIG